MTDKELAYLKAIEDHEKVMRALETLGKHLLKREDINTNVIESWHVISDFIMEFEVR